MTAEQKALYERSLADNNPSLVTPAERNAVFLRPPPEEEDRLCREKVGLSMGELKAKVMESEESANSLTEAETNIILRGADCDENVRKAAAKALWVFDLPDDEVELARQVRALLASGYEDEVQRRARLRDEAFEANRSAKRAERRANAKAEMEAKRRAGRTPWVQEMMDARVTRWGFVIFRTAYGEGTDERWKLFFALCLSTATSHL